MMMTIWLNCILYEEQNWHSLLGGTDWCRGPHSGRATRSQHADQRLREPHLQVFRSQGVKPSPLPPPLPTPPTSVNSNRWLD